MDPISAFSLAVNILTTVDMAIKTGATLRELYESTSGFTKETDGLVETTKQYSKSLSALEDAQLQLTSINDPAMTAAAQNCRRAIDAIQAILAKCKVPKKSSFRATTRTFFRLKVRYKGQLDEQQEALESATEQLRTALAVATRYAPKLIVCCFIRCCSNSYPLFLSLESRWDA